MPRRKRPKTKPQGRPPAPIDWDVVDRLLEAGCLGTEVAANLGIHPQTFYERVEIEKSVSFTQYKHEKASRGDSILRAKQFQVALKGSNPMLIWLGKNRLKQKDNPLEESEKAKALVGHLDAIDGLFKGMDQDDISAVFATVAERKADILSD